MPLLVPDAPARSHIHIHLSTGSEPQVLRERGRQCADD